MCDGVDECVVLFVAADLANQKCRVEEDSKDQDKEEYDPENQQRHFTPVEQDPTNIQRDRQRDKTRAERDEESY